MAGPFHTKPICGAKNLCMPLSLYFLFSCVFIVLTRSVDVPQQVVSIAEVEIVSIAAGSNHNIAVTKAGEVYSWGKGRFGRLGLGEYPVGQEALCCGCKKKACDVVRAEAGAT